MSTFEDAGRPASTQTTDIATRLDEFPVLATVVEAAKMVNTLASPGPFTVFAPTDAAFAKLPQGEIDRLLRPENRVKLTSFVASHILAGRLTVAELMQRIDYNGGRLVLRTVDNDTVTIEQRGQLLYIAGSKGTRAVMTNPDLLQSNGVIHVTDSVLVAPAC